MPFRDESGNFFDSFFLIYTISGARKRLTVELPTERKKVRMNVIQNIVYSRHIPWLTTSINLLVIHAIARKRHTSLYVLPSDPHTGWYIITGHGRQMHIGFPPWAIHLEYGRSHLWAWQGSAWNDKLFGFSILSKFVSGSAWTKIMH